MSILVVICIGLFVGIIAKALMPGADPGGWVVTTLIGIGGAVVASYLGQSVGWYGEGQPAGFIAAILGAMLLLLVYRLVRNISHDSHHHAPRL